MGGNWIACSEGERGRATHYSPIGFSESVAWKAIFKHWMARVCSLIHVESTSRSLSHPLQCFAGPVDGCWMGLRSGALALVGKWPITPSSGNPENSHRRGWKWQSLGMWNKMNYCRTILQSRVEKCIGTAARCKCHVLSACANWMHWRDEGSHTHTHTSTHRGHLYSLLMQT